jgi:hypothetical protein
MVLEVPLTIVEGESTGGVKVSLSSLSSKEDGEQVPDLSGEAFPLLKPADSVQ